MAGASFGFSRGSRAQTKGQKKANKGPTKGRLCGQLHARRAGGPLSFQERIQGLKNSSIARFDGLGCYQTRSEKSSRPAQLAVFRKPRRSAKASDGQTAAPQSQGAGQRRRFCASGFRANRSFFRSESKALKTAPSHGFRGFAAIKPGARKPIAARAACGLTEAAPQRQSQRQPKGDSQKATAKQQRPNRKEPGGGGAFARLDFAPIAPFSGANPRP